jgi:hypothetical protein
VRWTAREKSSAPGMRMTMPIHVTVLWTSPDEAKSASKLLAGAPVTR